MLQLKSTIFILSSMFYRLIYWKIPRNVLRPWGTVRSLFCGKFGPRKSSGLVDFFFFFAERVQSEFYGVTETSILFLFCNKEKTTITSRSSVVIIQTQPSTSEDIDEDAFPIFEKCNKYFVQCLKVIYVMTRIHVFVRRLWFEYTIFVVDHFIIQAQENALY